MDSAQWTQEFGVTRSMVEMGGPIVSSSQCTVRPSPGAAASMEKKTMRPPKDQTLNCPRCHSTNTKFCYYNNYSLTQPRYFCKSCRRYWTEGGTLRNVPVGGGSRKHTKKSAANSNPNNDHSHPTVVLPLHHHQNPKVHVHDQGQDLNLGYNIGVPRFLEFPKIEGKDVISSSPSSSSTTTATHMSALNFMRSENNINVERGPPYSFMIPNMAPITSSLDHHHHHHQTNYALFPSTGFSFQECKPSLASFDGSGYVNSHETEEDVNGTLMFTLGGSKRHSGTGEGGEHDDHEDKGSNENINSNGFWNGMLGGGGSW